jgi:nitroreductase
MTALKPELEQRYGADAPPIPYEANPVIETILRHKSVRLFRDEPLPEGTLELIAAAAQSAASSSNLQTWSVIALQDPDHKADAATLCGDQDFIRKAPLFLVFCADLNRLTTISEQQGLPGEGLEYFEMFLMATIDASLAAQNAALAAESLGLGICYVGAARNKPRELSALLQLPPRVFALFGMAIGIPDPTDTSTVKPRLPQPEVVHREVYHTAQRDHWINRYNATMADLYVSQHMNVQGDWARHSAKRVATVQSLTGRHILREFLNERGFELK